MTEKQIDKLIRDTVDEVGMPSGFAEAWSKVLSDKTPVPKTHETGLNPIKPFNNKVLEEILNMPVMNDEF